MKWVKLAISKLVSYIFFCLYELKILFNRSGVRVLLYTDSRGTEVAPFFKQRNPFYGYLDAFEGCDVNINFCPHKFTSILDFIEYLESDTKSYDFIVLHAGIVDFAPRPISSYLAMLETKQEIIHRHSWQHYFYERDDFYEGDYYGEKTISFASDLFLKEVLLPRLKKIDNLIYIGINPVLLDWRGNYWRDRPNMINAQLKLDEQVRDNLVHVVDLSQWEPKEIKRYTVDNVHYNALGMRYISSRLEKLKGSFQSKQF